MNVYATLKDNPRAALIEGMKSLRAGMLGVEGSGQHMQPMTHYPDWESNRIWFLTSRQSELVRGLRPGADAHFCLQDETHGFEACLRGRLTEDLDRARLDEYWSNVVAAWFKGGKQDPDLTMLRLDLTDAAIWGSTESRLRFGLEILLANLDPDDTPDVSLHRVVSF